MSNELGLEPGRQLTDSEKAALAKDNEKASMEAREQAAEQIQRDRESGQKPIITSVADSIKEKLQNEEFQTRQPEE